MADVEVPVGTRPDPGRSRDFAELTKPRISLMVMLTAAVGFVVGSGDQVDWLTFTHAVLATGLLAGGASTLNQLIERETDALMRRTAERPLPAGRMTPNHALRVGVALSVAGVLYLALAVNVLTALLGVVTLSSYVFVYTPLKRHSSLATLVGAVPGALPPVMGFAAARDAVDPAALVLFTILFLWQLPHFLAIAWLYRVDYERGGFPLLTRGDEGGARTSRQMILYCAALLPVSLLPAALGVAGPWYAGAALLAGVAFLVACGAFARAVGPRTARRVILTSVLYLPVVMVAWVADRKPHPTAALFSVESADGARLSVAPAP